MGPPRLRPAHLLHAAEPPLPPGRLLLDRRIPASGTAKNELLDELLAALAGAHAVTSEGDIKRCRLPLDEALVNAITHGCQGNPQRTVRARVFCDGRQWAALVEDEGPGFRAQDLPHPTTPAGLEYEGGRGILLICSMMDEVSYWRSGRALLMVKRFSRPSGEAGVSPAVVPFSPP